MTNKTITGKWNYPTTVFFGPGAIQKLPEACKKLGMKNPLLITDEGLKDNAITKTALAVNEKAGLKTGLFAAVKGNPTGRNITDGIKTYHAGKHDGVIAFGGGSGLDAAAARQYRRGGRVDNQPGGRRVEYRQPGRNARHAASDARSGTHVGRDANASGGR